MMDSSLRSDKQQPKQHEKEVVFCVSDPYDITRHDNTRSPPTLRFSFTNLLVEVSNDAVTAAVDSSPQQRVALFNQSKYVTVQFTGVTVTTSWLTGILIHTSTALLLQSSHMQS